MLTHAAIAAREYGIPAVVGTWNATNSIRNGDIIRVDGNKGVVEVVRRVGRLTGASDRRRTGRRRGLSTGARRRVPPFA